MRRVLVLLAIGVLLPACVVEDEMVAGGGGIAAELDAKVPEAVQLPGAGNKCRPRQVRLGKAETDGAMNQTMVIMRLRLRDGRPCRINTPVTVEVLRRDGTAIAMRGNPATHRLRGKVSARRGLAWVGWGSNVCPRPLLLRVTVRGYLRELVPIGGIDGSGGLSRPTCADARWRLSAPPG